jgi:ribosomal protein L40E
MEPSDIDKKLAAVCGLFCPACHVFIGNREDPERLTAMSKRINRPLEDLRCMGCRSETRSFFCREICTMAKCAAEKDIEFCGECAVYPCKDLKEFQSLAPHRIELWKNHARIKEAGWETWYAEMIEHYSCPQCHALNSAYDVKCRKCGGEPSCEYVRLHKDEILRHMAK